MHNSGPGPQVRALAGSSYKSDEAKFKEMADASTALAKAYIQLFKDAAGAAGASPPTAEGGAAKPAGSGTRQLAAARMHLRGVLKQCEASFSEHASWQELAALMQQVTALEDEALAAAKAAAADSK